eukprot:CAMPEP_0178478932 /NCGR_PEP_ID=MMETSP0696-20121128/4917_1 /TAXON_ID=265572 /ORGANISM="Extubocellulus spinifer, Strain CCMP396" /LENGTH=166 /DNA_ID=CAMNT_0020106321 /DNA_START=71 /DNA_END=571 /DNA_ORIENTATION=-
MSATVLSPLAAPFHPREGEETFCLVYNDGLPAASFVSGEHEVLHNIQDDALEEVFPPDAAEAAELDAAQDFVMTMAFLGLMEEEEEMSRLDYSFARAKRWSVRREIGLKGRPQPARPRSRLGRDRSRRARLNPRQPSSRMTLPPTRTPPTMTVGCVLVLLPDPIVR